MGKRKKSKHKDGKSYSGLADHARHKKSLVPPLMKIPNLKPMSWMNDRLPEMLWCALLLYGLGRAPALNIFRKTAKLIPQPPDGKTTIDPGHSGLATIHASFREEVLSSICYEDAARDSLRPLLLLDKLPARESWLKAIQQFPVKSDWETLMTAVARVLFHQTQEATDCRWVRVLFRVLSGKLVLNSRETVLEVLQYPEYGEPQKVRPTIRATEGALEAIAPQDTTWSEDFWKQCLADTACQPKHTMETTISTSAPITITRVREARVALAEHQRKSILTTDVDPRHDAVFGLAADVLAILEELFSVGNSATVLGRIGLRSLLECFITLSYLKKENDRQLWLSYRRYGASQAKLAFLKLDELSKGLPTSVSREVLEQLANEDAWQEFVTIELGHWASKDLRKMSETAGVKLDYDAIYPWTSAFTHGNWAAVRNTCFDLCLNPLHRLHRILRSDTAALGDVIPDAWELVSKTLRIVEELYPGLAGYSAFVGLI